MEKYPHYPLYSDFDRLKNKRSRQNRMSEIDREIGRQPGIPMEWELQDAVDSEPIDERLPNLTVNEMTARMLEKSRIRARIIIQLGAIILPSVVEFEKRNLAGRQPNMFVKNDRLYGFFHIADKTTTAFLKADSMMWALKRIHGDPQHPGFETILFENE